MLMKSQARLVQICYIYDHFIGVLTRSTYKIVCLCYQVLPVAAVLYHHISHICCRKSHHIPVTLALAHTPFNFSIDLHTVWQHLVIAHFLMHLLHRTQFQMMSRVPHHCHHFSFVRRHTYFFHFIKADHSLRSLYISQCH